MLTPITDFHCMPNSFFSAEPKAMNKNIIASLVDHTCEGNEDSTVSRFKNLPTHYPTLYSKNHWKNYVVINLNILLMDKWEK